MKKINLLKWGFLCLFSALGTFAWADVTLSSVDVSSDAVSCYFTSGEPTNTTNFKFTNDTYSTAGGHGSAIVGGTTYNDCLKIASTTTVKFITKTASTELTIIVTDEDVNEGHNDITITDPNSTAETLTLPSEGNVNVFTYTCETVGEYTISRGSNENHVVYIGLSADVEEEEADVYEPVVIDDDDITCWFTDGTPTNQTDFTFTSCNYGTNSNNGSVVINGNTIVDCLKMESSTQVEFTIEKASVLTLVFAESETTPNIYLYKGSTDSNDNRTTLENKEGNVITYTIDEADTYYLKKDGSYHVFYIGLSAVSSDDPEEGGGSSTGTITEANWDWPNDNPTGIKNCATFEGSTGYIESDVAGLYLYVDAMSGKVGPNGDNPQFTTGAKLHVPVVNVGDVVSFTGYSGLEYTIGDTQQTTSNNTAYDYTATSDDADNGYVEIVSTGGQGYMRAIKVTYTTPVSTDDISSDFIRPSVKLTSEAPTSPCGYLENESVITFTAVNLPEGATVNLKIDGEENVYYSDELTADEDNSYSCSLAEQVNLEDGVVYTVYVSVTSTEDGESVENTYTLFTVTGDGSYKSSVEFVSADPDPDADDTTLYTEETTITVTFNGEIKDVTAQMSLGRGNTADISSDNIKQSEDNSKVWTITLTADQMSTASNMNMLSIMVYATGSDDLPVYNDGVNYISLVYYNIDEAPVVYDEVSLTYSPKNESEIYGNLVITATYKYDASDYAEDDVVYLNTDSYGDCIKVTDENGDEVEGANVDCETDTDTSCIITITGLSAGTYNVIIGGQDSETGAEFYVTLNEDYDTKVAVNKADTLTYTITDVLNLELTSGDVDGVSTDAMENVGDIYVETNSLEELYLTLTITDTDTDSEESTSYTYAMTYEESDNDYALSTDTLDITTMYSGHSYAFTVKAYSLDDTETALATLDLYTLNGSATETENPATFTMEVLPTSANAEFTSGVEGTLIVNCSDYVTVKATIDDVDVTATVNGSDVDDNNNSMSWTLTIPAETMTQYAGSSFEITIVATNASDESVTESYTYSVASSTSGEGGEGTVNTEYTVTTTPENNSTISNEVGVSDIVIIYDTTVDGNWDGEFGYDEFLETSVIVYNADNEVAASVEEWQFDEYEEYDEDGVPTVVGYTFHLNSTITTNGTYHFTIPEGAFLLGADQSIVSEKIEVTFNIADASGINGITLKAGADDRFYNLNGQRVTAPRNGVFILNGKKVLIK